MGHKVFMNKGDGKTGYNENSTPQRSVTDALFFPLIDKALQHASWPTSENPIVVADLGSSACQNSFVNASYIVDSLRSRCLGSGKTSNTSPPQLSEAEREVQVCFNDLPWNDFNALFKLVCEKEAESSSSKFFVAGVPGSFFNRLFPRSSVHVFYSILAAHYLSKIPNSMVDEDSPAFNRGKLWVAGATDATAQAYKEQAFQDLTSFLQARSEELVPGGLLCFLLKTRPVEKANVLQASADSFCAVEVCLHETIDEVLAKGLLKEQQVNTLNVPVYYPSFEDELMEIVKSFDHTFKVLTAKEIGFPLFMPPGSSSSDPNSLVQTATGNIRGILGGLFGQVMAAEEQKIFWQHFAKLAVKYVSDFKQVCHFGCIALVKQ